MPAYSVSRSVEIAVAAEKVFESVVDFKTWTTWSPWLICEPDAQVTVSENSTSRGSLYAWKGEMTGQGEVEHMKIDYGKKVDDEIRFIKPFKSQAQVGFEVTPLSTGTKLTWTMHGRMPWFMFWMVPSLETMVGMDYQRGLLMLKDWLETGSIPSKSVVVGVQETGPLRMAGVFGTCRTEEIGPAMEETFATANREFDLARLPRDGAMISVYTKFLMAKGRFDYLSGYVLPADASLRLPSSLTEWTLPRCSALRVDHHGAYRHLGNGWSIANQIARYRKYKQRSCGAFEIYRQAVPQVAEDQQVTEIYLPLR